MSENISDQIRVFKEHMDQLSSNFMTKLQPYITNDDITNLTKKLENGDEVIITTPISKTTIKLNNKDEWISFKDTNELFGSYVDSDYKVAKVDKYKHTINVSLKDIIKYMYICLNDGCGKADNIYIYNSDNTMTAFWLNADIYGEHMINELVNQNINGSVLQGIYGILYIEKNEDDENDYRKCVFNKHLFDKYLKYDGEWKIIDEKVIENYEVIITHNTNYYTFRNKNILDVEENIKQKIIALLHLKTIFILQPLFKVLKLFEDSEKSYEEFYIKIT